MAQEHRVEAGGLGLSLVEQNSEHRRNSAGIDVRRQHELDPLGVCLCLIVSAELCKDAIGGQANQLLAGTALAECGKRAPEGHTEARVLLLFHLLNAVAPHHMPDFMADDARNLVQRLRPLNQAAIDVDVAPRNGEGVHVHVVHDLEVPGELAPEGKSGEGVAQGIDVSLDFRILDQRKLFGEIGRVTGPHLALLLLGNRGAAHHGGGGDGKSEKRNAPVERPCSE